MELLLRAVDVEDQHRWRWVLTDPASAAPLADHPVALDPRARGARAFEDLPRYLRRKADPDRRAESEAYLLEEVGAWLGLRVLGEEIARRIVAAAPVTVRVEVPDEGEFLLFRPLELAHVDGVALARRGDVSMVYAVAAAGREKPPPTDRLRMLAVFGHRTGSTALGSRRERYALTRLIRDLAARRRRAIDLEVLQYGVTRHRLTERVTAGGGPDVLHLSGPGRLGELLLEKPDGSADRVSAGELMGLLSPAAGRLRLAVISACEPAEVAAGTRHLPGLTEPAVRAERPAAAPARPALETGLAHRLARRLDCAVVAMRYPVSDEFAIGFAQELYEGLLDLDLPLDRAVPRAVAAAAGPEPSPARPALCLASPAVFGTRAVGLRLSPPAGRPWLGPAATWTAFVPPEPARFVGRTRVMAKARAALAPGSDHTAVLFHGLAGAGKTTCALELTHRHAAAFGAVAFWRAPTRADASGAALPSLAVSLARQLDGFARVDPLGFLPRLSRLLADTAVLLVLDNLETLLTPAGEWRDQRWADLITALTDHDGDSRAVLTSRVRPHGLAARALVEPVPPLSRDESVLLARELPHLRALLHIEPSPTRRPGAEVAADRAALTEVLRLVRGHPKLLELADGLLDVLGSWASSTADSLPEGARSLLRMLSLIEADDRIPPLGLTSASGRYARGVSERLTHVDETGAARMVDVSGKPATVRRAVAAGRVATTPEVVALLRADALPKGDALAVARLAGIMGAKRTPDLVPLCHPIALHSVTVDVSVVDGGVEIVATTKTADRTGVEMEALTAVAAAGLALVDMVKAVDPAASIEQVRVLRKEGGKTGEWVRP